MDCENEPGTRAAGTIGPSGLQGATFRPHAVNTLRHRFGLRLLLAVLLAVGSVSVSAQQSLARGLAVPVSDTDAGLGDDVFTTPPSAIALANTVALAGGAGGGADAQAEAFGSDPTGTSRAFPRATISSLHPPSSAGGSVHGPGADRPPTERDRFCVYRL